MARRGEQIDGLPVPDQGVAEALIGLHGRSMEVLRGAGTAPVGLMVVGRTGDDKRLLGIAAAIEARLAN